MSSPLNPPNLRFPFNLPDNTEPEVRKALEWTFNGLLIHEQAFAAIGKPTSVTSTTTIIQTGGSGGGGGGSAVGGVNDQIGVTSYTTQQSDYGVKIIVGDSSAIAIALNGGVTTPWFTIIDNDSSSIASLTPSGATSLVGENTIPPGCFAIVYFDGASFWCGATRLASDTRTGYVQGDVATIHVDSTTGIMSTSGAFVGSYVAVTTTYAIQPLDYQVDCTSGTFTVTLPTAVGIKGHVYSIKNSGTGTITVATTSAQTIDGVTTQTLAQWDNLMVMSNNAGWIIL